MAMLNVEAIDLHYGAAQALRRVNITASLGEVTCVLGRNGVGKSSLLRAIVGQQPISSGRVMFNGTSLAGMRPEDRARLGIERFERRGSRDHNGRFGRDRDERRQSGQLADDFEFPARSCGLEQKWHQAPQYRVDPSRSSNVIMRATF